MDRSSSAAVWYHHVHHTEHDQREQTRELVFMEGYQQIHPRLYVIQ